MLVIDIDAVTEAAPLPAQDEQQHLLGSPLGWGGTAPYRPVVLVVDDDEDARATVATMIEGDDISVIRVSTGEAALHAVAVFPIAAIVLDVLLPDWTGFDICRILRDDPETRHVPIIMLTALTRVADEVAGVLAGADAYLIKPVSREKLLMHLRDVI